MNTVLSFTVLGHPETAGSKRGFPIKRKGGGMGVIITDSNPNTKAWQNTVAKLGMEAMTKLSRPLDKPLIEGAVTVRFQFFFMRPKGHYNTKGELRPSAPTHMTTRPDALKLSRAIEDALTSVVWRDDSQIVVETLEKKYGTPERVEIEITEIIEEQRRVW